MDQAVEENPSLAQADRPSMKEAWEMVSGQLRMEMKRADYESWVAALQPLSFNEGVYRIGAVNAYARDWVESRLRTKIARLLESVFLQPVTVHFSLVHGDEHGQARARQEAVKQGAEREGAAQEAPVAAGDVTSLRRSRAANGSGRKRNADLPLAESPEPAGSPRKIQLQRAYGTERARVVQPERGMFLTMYFFNNWLPLLGHSAMTTVIAARSLCYWNPLTGEMRNVVETDMSELARRASVSVRTVKDVLNNDLVRRYFLRYKVRRVMTVNGVRTAGIVLQVRMDDPLTPEDQEQNHLPEEERWYTVDFEDETED